MLARMTTKGQVTIPGEVRKKLKLGKGSLISFTLMEGERRAELTVVDDDVMALRGSVRVQDQYARAHGQRGTQKRPGEVHLQAPTALHPVVRVQGQP